MSAAHAFLTAENRLFEAPSFGQDMLHGGIGGIGDI